MKLARTLFVSAADIIGTLAGVVVLDSAEMRRILDHQRDRDEAYAKLLGHLAVAERERDEALARAAANLKMVVIDGPVAVHALASRLRLKSTDVLLRALDRGLVGAHLNTELDVGLARRVAEEFGWTVVGGDAKRLGRELDELAEALGRVHEWDYGRQRADHETLLARVRELVDGAYGPALHHEPGRDATAEEPETCDTWTCRGCGFASDEAFEPHTWRDCIATMNGWLEEQAGVGYDIAILREAAQAVADHLFEDGRDFPKLRALVALLKPQATAPAGMGPTASTDLAPGRGADAGQQHPAGCRNCELGGHPDFCVPEDF